MLGDATTYEVDVTRTVARSVVLHLQRTRLEYTLLANENVYSVMLVWWRTSRPSRWRRCWTPIYAVQVDQEARVWAEGGEVGEDVWDYAGGVVGRGGERGKLKLVQVDWVKDIPSVLGEKQG